MSFCRLAIVGVVLASTLSSPSGADSENPRSGWYQFRGPFKTIEVNVGLEDSLFEPPLGAIRSPLSK